MLWQKIRSQWWPPVREPARYGLIAAAVATVVSLAIPPSYVVHSAVRATSSSQSALGGSIVELAQRFGLAPQMGGVSPDVLAVLFETEDVLESVARTRFSRGTFED